MIIDNNLANEIRSLKRQVADLQRKNNSIMNGLVKLGIAGNITFDPDNNLIIVGANGEIKLDATNLEFNIKDKIKLKTNGSTQHEVTLDDKIRLRVDGTNVYATFGANGEIKLDATNKKINVGSKVVLDASESVGEIFVYDNSGNPSIYMKGGTT